MPQEKTRSDATRERLRKAAFARFAVQGLDQTSIAEIAADAGVSERTFYRYFPAKEHALFADYEQELDWFRIALRVRPGDEPISRAVINASRAFPHEKALTELARLRGHGLEPSLIRHHLNRVQSVFTEEIEAHILHRDSATAPEDVLRARITAHTIAGALFSALETWLALPAQSLDELGRLTDIALKLIADGVS